MKRGKIKLNEMAMILTNSQEVLNNMTVNSERDFKRIQSNQMQLEKLISEQREKEIYEKYINIHDIIRKSAKEYLNTGRKVYKFQPIIYYYCKSNYEIKDNVLELFIDENKVIFDLEMNHIEIHDEFYIPNDSLFKKANIALLLKSLISQKNIQALNKLESYFEELLDKAKKIIEEEQ